MSDLKLPSGISDLADRIDVARLSSVKFRGGRRIAEETHIAFITRMDRILEEMRRSAIADNPDRGIMASLFLDREEQSARAVVGVYRN